MLDPDESRSTGRIYWSAAQLRIVWLPCLCVSTWKPTSNALDGEFIMVVLTLLVQPFGSASPFDHGCVEFLMERRKRMVIMNL